MIGSGVDTVSYVDQMVLGQLMEGLRDRQTTRETIKEAAMMGTWSSDILLIHVKQLVQVKEQAREEATKLAMEDEIELISHGPGAATI